ncbi:MAG: dockerin type I domain-containing protein [Planctomycetota bacterium]
MAVLMRAAKLLAGVTVCFVSLCQICGADVTFSVTYDDPSGLFDPYLPLLTENIVASGQHWSNIIDGDGNLEIVVIPTTASVASASSLTSSISHNNGTFNVFHQGAAAEIIKGFDPNGATPDIRIFLNPDRLSSSGTVHLDPDPTQRTAPIPSNKRDAMTILIHELGHGLMLNGWMNSTTGEYPGDFQSTFDEHRTWDGFNQFYEGATAVQVNNGPIGLTYANGSHIGNDFPRPGDNLLGDIMNGERFDNARRYGISPLNVAIAKDVGFDIKVGKTPETRIHGVEFSVGWESQNYFDPISSWLTRTEFHTAAFGTPTNFDFLGNTLTIDSEVTVLDSNSETWTISIDAADGGALFEPTSSDWKGWRIREFALGEFDSPEFDVDEGGNPLDVLNFVNFDIPVSVGEWSVQSLELFDLQGLAISTDVFAKAESGGIYLQREFDGEGLVLVDESGGSSTNLGISEIKFTIGVQTFFSEVVGDFDSNFVVDGADFLLWQRQFGQSGSGLSADGNGDGTVDELDLAIWSEGIGSGAVSALAAVPEPNALLIATLAAGTLLSSGRQRY